uniref:Uncharacterized protein n=1 Tax=Amphiprion percula TaxID=161767 RepID=A0A3P8RS83_AMPPE
MTVPTVRQLFLLCLFGFFGCWSTTGRWISNVRGIQNDDLSGVLWKDQNEVRKHFKVTIKILNVMYSHSVHPLMRLSPKLSQRRKKKVVLLVRKT